MSRPRGGYIGHNAAPAASALNSAASGIWTLREAESLKRAGTWPIVTPALLDAVTSAAAAYSLRNLFAGATTAVLRVRRSSDNAEQDFNGAQIRDGSLASFVGAGNNGFVRTWYDQSGNGRHVGQATTSLQPSIVSSGSVLLLNGLPAIDWPSNSANKVLTSTISIATAISTLAVFSVVRRAGGYVKLYNLGDDNPAEGVALTPLTGQAFEDWTDNAAILLTNGFASDSSSRVIAAANTISSSATTQNLLFATVSSAAATMFRNKSEVSYTKQSAGSPSTLTNAPFYLGNNNGSVQQFIGRMQEVIIWSSDKSSDRTVAENEVGSYYGI